MKKTKRPPVDRSKTPLCVRFKPKDLAAVRLAATKRGEASTVFIREIVLLRVTALENGMAVPRLDFSRDRGTLGEPISIRLRAGDYRRVRKFAASEGQVPSSWVRAIAVEYAARPVSSPSVVGSAA